MSLILIPNRHNPGVKPLIYLYISLFFWAFGYIFESAAMEVPQKLFWSQFAYIGTVTTPLLLLAFAQEYSNQYILKKPIHFILASIIPFLTLMFSWTNEMHHWVWVEINIQGPMHLATYQHGFWFWIFVLYTYIFITVSFILLFSTALRLFKIYRRQAIIIIFSCLFGVVGNIMYLAPSNPIPGMEWTLIGFIITSCVLTFGILRYRLFELLPAARNTLVEIMSEGVLLVDNGGKIRDVNRSFLEIVNFDRSKEYIGKPVFEVLKGHPAILEIFKMAETNVDNKRTEIQLDAKTLDARLTILKGNLQTFKGHLLVLTDISSLKKTQNALSESNSILSQEIEHRQKLIDELDAYAHTVAHDLKTPLNGLAGFSELLADELKDTTFKEAKKLSELINSTSFKMVAIIEELLFLSSVRSKDVELEPIDMESVFDSAYQRFISIESFKDIKISMPETWPSSYGYAPWIEEIWVNYLSNALKYGGDPLFIDVNTRIEQNWVWFSVCDNGPGVPEELKNKLFIAYSRLTTKKIEGQGLGLSIVKRIIDKLGGKVKVENSPGSGACFSFALPAYSQKD